jgi:hypothetical protein
MRLQRAAGANPAGGAPQPLTPQMRLGSSGSSNYFVAPFS